MSGEFNPFQGMFEEQERRAQLARTPFLGNRAEQAALELKQYAQWDTSHTFQQGDLVEWKPGMQNKAKPHMEQPVVIVEVLHEPLITETEDEGSPYFREPLTLVLGMTSDDGEFVVYYYDGRRFMPYTGEVAQ